MIEKDLFTIAIFEGIEKAEGCPLCYLWTRRETVLMEHLLRDELVMDPAFRVSVLDAKGFCNHHMHLLYKATSARHTDDGLGYAIYMQGVVQRIIADFKSSPLDRLRRLEDLVHNNIFTRSKKSRQAFSHLTEAVEKTVEGQRTCPACEFMWSSDEMNLHTLVRMLDDKDFREEFGSSKGLCLSHFVSAVRMVSRVRIKNSVQITRALIEAEMKRLELTENYLSEFIRKQRWEFRHEPWGPEANANPMVLNLLVGAEGLLPKLKTFRP